MPGSIEERLDKILEDTPILDTHNDLPYLLRVQLHNEIEGNRFCFNGDLESHTDVPRLVKGRVGAQFWSVFIECKNPDPLYQDFNQPNSAVRDTLEQIDVTKRALAKVPEVFELCNTVDEAKDAYRRGKIASMLGAEGLHQVDVSIAVIRQFYDLGVRYITLTHNCDNPFATAASSVAGGLPDKGLTEYGKAGIKEMNRLGMMVDLSHVSYQTMHDTLDVTKAPVMFSHSSAYSITQHRRNVPDDVLKRIKELDGVVQVNFYPLFIKQTEEKNKHGLPKTTIQDAVDHILHIAKVAGWKHVGLGSDFDGIPEGPEGLEDVSKYPDLIKRVMERSNATDDDIRGFIGGNLLRVWKKTEEVAAVMQEHEPIVEDNWPDRTWDFWKSAASLPKLDKDVTVDENACING
jgi:membrane dipeptidase